MKVVSMQAKAGKTAAAIRLSAATRAVIVTLNHERVNRIMKRAQDMGLTIPQPVAISDTRIGVPLGIGSVIVDDADECLMSLVGVPVIAITVTQWPNDDI